MSITFSSCFYSVKSKFDESMYYKWITHLLLNVKNFNLVIYTDDKNYIKITELIKNNPNIKLILRPLDKLHNYKYKDSWIKNESNNISWELQMVWAEKIHFVYDTICNKYFETNLFGWIDIGYFRGRKKDIKITKIPKWPNKDKINKLNIDKIYYGFVNSNKVFNAFISWSKNKNNILYNECAIAGGFFIIHEKNIEWWKTEFDSKLQIYFNNNLFIKDDQTILTDCIFSNLNKFEICFENNYKYDNWFMFQRLLL